MNPSDPPSDGTAPQSGLSEAVEQAAAATKDWFDDISGFVKHDADQISAGQYGLGDLATAPIRMMRIWLSNTVRTAFVVSDNLALLGYTRPGAPLPRTMSLGLSIPANIGVKLTASEMVGQLLGQSIPSSKIQIRPDEHPPQAADREVTVTVEINIRHAPDDLYQGRVFSVDGAVSVPFSIAIDELGVPLQP